MLPQIEVADPTFCLTQLQYTDTGPTSPSDDPITQGACHGSHWSTKFFGHRCDSTQKYPMGKRESNPGICRPLGEQLYHLANEAVATTKQQQPGLASWSLLHECVVKVSWSLLHERVVKEASSSLFHERVVKEVSWSLLRECVVKEVSWSLLHERVVKEVSWSLLHDGMVKEVSWSLLHEGLVKEVPGAFA